MLPCSAQKATVPLPDRRRGPIRPKLSSDRLKGNRRMDTGAELDDLLIHTGERSPERPDRLAACAQIKRCGQQIFKRTVVGIDQVELAQAVARPSTRSAVLRAHLRRMAFRCDRLIRCTYVRTTRRASVDAQVLVAHPPSDVLHVGYSLTIE